MLGPDFSLDPQVSFETPTGSIRPVIGLRGSPFIVELFLLGDDPFQQERFARRVSVFPISLVLVEPGRTGPRQGLPGSAGVSCQRPWCPPMIEPGTTRRARQC
jgi:hypothetical protein